MLIRSGFQAYLVGGSVRDLLLGTQVNDFDIVTDANFEEQKKIFAGHFSSHSHQNGINYGIAVYPDEEIDLAQMRNIPAAYYGLKNIPDFNPEELFSDNLRNDSFQRDLTLNAVYYDMKTGDLIDFQGGLYALREGIIESPAEPDVHFTDDPTSAIRAMRFKARYNFRFSDSVEKVMRENALKYIKLLTPESISFYLNSMFGHGYSEASYEILNDYGVFEHFLPALKDICGTEEYKLYAMNEMRVLDAQKSPDKNLWLAILLWPAVKNSDADTVLNEQGKICRFSDGQIDTLKEIFMTENEMETVSTKRRVGILGGTFDPVHNDHIALAESAYRQLGFNEIWLMPNGNPPHKSNVTDAEDRCKMIELAIKDYPHLKLSRYEVDGDNTGHHYTYETMAGLKKLYPDTEFCFICGGDTLSRMETWDGFDTLIKLCSFAAIARDEKDFSDKVEYLSSKYGMTINIIYPENFSSTQIRKRIQDGETIEGLVPYQAEAYIYEHGLYGAKKDNSSAGTNYDKAIELMKREHFREAYILLQAGAKTDKTLSEILSFWDKIISPKKSLQEAA